MIRAGRLGERVTIQSLTTTAVSGGFSESWTTVATVWAGVEPLLGRELMMAEQAQYEARVRVRMRYRSGINSSMRVVHGSTVYQVESVINSYSADRELVLMCKEVTANE